MGFRKVFEQAYRNKEARAAAAAAAAPRGKGVFGKLLGPAKIAQLQGRSMPSVGQPMPAPAAGAPTMGGRPGVMGDSGENTQQLKKGGKVKKMAKGGSTASKRADGCATKGKTKGRFV